MIDDISYGMLFQVGIACPARPRVRLILRRHRKLISSATRKITKMIKELGGRHSSMVLSAPTILWPQVRIRSTPSILCSIFIVEIKTLSDN